MSGPVTDPLPIGQILVGDVRVRLRELPPSSVDAIITSPPYFALRDYGHTDQLGLEPNVGQWAENLVAVCRDLARVLKPSGSLWLNVGDSYSGHARQGAPKKSLLLGPQRVAMALLQDGWLIRNQVVWAKSNPMPSSVADRLSCTYEVMFLLTQSPRYFFDLDPIRRPLTTKSRSPRTPRVYRYLPEDAMPPDTAFDDDQGLNRLRADGRAGHPLGGNPGDVWRFATAGYRGAHFATFPPSLIERPLLATCPERVCTACGRPWLREPVDRTRRPPGLAQLVPGCNCQATTRPGIVLDPFMGAGTVAIAAEMHGRQWTGIELNPAFASLAMDRLDRWRRERR